MEETIALRRLRRRKTGRCCRTCGGCGGRESRDAQRRPAPQPLQRQRLVGRSTGPVVGRQRGGPGTPSATTSAPTWAAAKHAAAGRAATGRGRGRGGGPPASLPKDFSTATPPMVSPPQGAATTAAAVSVIRSDSKADGLRAPSVTSSSLRLLRV